MPRRPKLSMRDDFAIIQAKQEICAAIRQSQKWSQMTDKQFAYNSGLHPTTLSLIARYPTVHKVSFNQLFRVLALAEPRFRILVSI